MRTHSPVWRRNKVGTEKYSGRSIKLTTSANHYQA